MSNGLRYRKGHSLMAMVPPIVIDQDRLDRSNADELRAMVPNLQDYVKQLQTALTWALTLAEDGGSKLEDWNAWESEAQELLGLAAPHVDPDSSVTPVPDGAASHA